MKANSTKVVDQYQNTYCLKKCIGKGGQGAVYATDAPDIAIKIAFCDGEPIRDATALSNWKKKSQLFRRLPLPENLAIASPLALLEKEAGYVMHLLTGMLSFESFFLAPQDREQLCKEKKPDWLAKANDYQAAELIFYAVSGGLRRRLLALSKASSILARLHAQGLFYGDISFSNMFVSPPDKETIVRFIDADNIRFESPSSKPGLYTPGFGAPEVVQGKSPNTCLADCHAFAVAAFKLLSLIHPFEGELFDGADWEDDEPMDQKAYAGLLPWVDDPNDRSNAAASGRGLPRALLLTPRLKELFEETFGSGRLDAGKRPAIWHWPSALAQAADTLVRCPKCGMHHYEDFVHPHSGKKCCPYCGSDLPKRLIAEAYHWKGEETFLAEPCWRFIHELKEGVPVALPRRLFECFSMTEHHETELYAGLQKDSFLIKRADKESIPLYLAGASNMTNFVSLTTQFKIWEEKPVTRFWLYSRGESPRLVLCTICEGDA